MIYGKPYENGLRRYRRLLCVSLLAGVIGCGGYGKVSPKAYEFAKSLYSVSNQRSTERLEAVQSIVDEAHQAGQLTDKEHDWLNDIITQGKNGDWESARQSCRRVMEDQVER
ncbi:MAG: hypothetical protein AAF497_01345 [Planctomycetota bacterium]